MWAWFRSETGGSFLELILVIDYGSGRAQSVAKKVRKQKVFSEIVSWPRAEQAVLERKPLGLITVGAPRGGLQDRLEASNLPLWPLGSALPASADLDEFLEKCGCSRDWTWDRFIEETIEEIRAQVGSGRVICGLSGGLDSFTAAVLVHRALGDQLTSVFVDHGLLRHGESEQIVKIAQSGFRIPLVQVQAQERFLSKLKGIEDPEEKRKIIGTEFIRVFEEEAAKIGDAAYLVQGTLYSDLLESGAGQGQLVKSHHNVGGLPPDLNLELIEPLKSLFKSEVRSLAQKLNLPEEIVWRHPFPGPGLAIRIIGDVTSRKLEIVRRADAVVREEIQKAGYYRKIWQALVVLTNIRTVGIESGVRTYDYVLALRFVNSEDGVHAEWSRVPHQLLGRISGRLLNEVKGVSRVVYDLSSKPPATIEWE